MKQPEYFKRIIVFILISIIILIQMILFGILWYTYYRLQIEKPFWNKGNLTLIGLYGLIFFLFSRILGGLKVGYLKKLDVIYTHIISVICTNAVIYLQIVLINRWFVSVWPIILLTLADIVLGIFWTYISDRVYMKLYPPKRMLVIYGDRKPDSFLGKISKRRDKYTVNGMVHTSTGEQEIKKRIREYEAVIIWDLPSQIRNDYLKYCFAHSIRCYVTPKISDIIIQGSERLHLFDTPLLLSRNLGLTAEQTVFKRMLDLVVSLLAIILCAPLMLVIAVMIKLYDKGPVFYHQDRLTIGGKTFRMHKFRSMKSDSEKSGARLASKNDSRITPVGRILRKTHLDEIPQLFNVLSGDMSIVGPRPERKELMRQYSKSIPEFYYRLKLKAGLTGYAQVFGKYNTTPYDKLKLDLFYIENYSFILDIKLMFMTFKILFQKETSEGVEPGQINALENRPHSKEHDSSKEQK